MERIVIEVDKRLGKAWRKASEEKKKEIGNLFNNLLAKELMNSQSGKEERKYLGFFR